MTVSTGIKTKQQNKTNKKWIKKRKEEEEEEKGSHTNYDHSEVLTFQYSDVSVRVTGLREYASCSWQVKYEYETTMTILCLFHHGSAPVLVSKW